MGLAASRFEEDETTLSNDIEGVSDEEFQRGAAAATLTREPLEGANGVSEMKAQDMISLMEYMKAFSKTEKSKTPPPKKEKEKNFFEAFADMKVQVDQFNQFLKDQEKLGKKEEKKEEKKGLTIQEWMLILVGFYPIIGATYLLFVLRAMGKI